MFPEDLWKKPAGTIIFCFAAAAVQLPVFLQCQHDWENKSRIKSYVTVSCTNQHSEPLDILSHAPHAYVALID